MQLTSFRAQDGRQPISVDLNYPVPVTDRVKLGGTPRDYFDQDPSGHGEVSCKNGVCASLPQGLWQDQPRLDDAGQPVVRTVTQHVEGRPASVPGSFLGYGALGGLAGGLVGGVLGWLVAGQPALGAAGGAALVGVSVGALMARRASQDRVALEWRTHPIVVQDMTGYRETVTPGQHNGRQGYYHRFEPIVARQIVGSYQTPHVVHYTEKEKSSP